MIEKKKIERYFPHGVIDKISSFGENPFDLVENRYAVVMFADISGYTNISEKLAPEKIAQILNRCFTILIDIIEKHKGYVDKFIGDCLLSLFGIGYGEKSEISSVLCAIEMMEAVKLLNEEIKRDYDFDFNLSIGIHCGNLLLGNIGSETRMDYTVIGDTVNTASRIQQIANPGEILISEKLDKKIVDFINTEKLSPINVKNKSEPLNLSKILGKKESKQLSYKKIDLIGRDRELKLLKNIIFETSKNRLWILEGETGSGKSSIVEEFYSLLSSNEYKALYFKFQTDIYSQNFILKPFKELYYHFSNLIYNEKFKNNKEIYDEFKLQNDYLKNFFTKDDKTGNTQISSENLFDTFRIFLKVLSIFNKVIIIFEDIQYFDNFSTDLFKYLIKTLSSFEIYFILTKEKNSRFNFETSIENIIPINNLTNVETEIFANGYLSAPISHKPHISIRSGWQSTFSLEVMTYLKSENLLIKNDNIYSLATSTKFEIPDSISVMILAKVDKLNYKEKLILNTASFLGNAIPYELLEKTLSLTDFENSLNNLVEFGFLNITLEGNTRYIGFKNQITIEAIYGSIVEKKKIETHFKIANMLLEKNYKNIEKIAYHFEMANREYEAITYYFLSGIRAKDNKDFESAKKYFNKALYYAEKNQNSSKKLLFFSNDEYVINDFFVGRLFFRYEIKVKLSIEVIYYIYGETLYFSDNNFRTFFEKSLLFAEKNGNTLIYFLSKIMLFNNYIYNNRNIDLFLYLNSLEKTAKSLKDDFFLAYYYTQYITFQIERPEKLDEKRKKIVIENFHNAKKIIDNSKISEKQKDMFYIFWYWNSGHYYKSINKDVKTIVGVFNLGEQYIIDDYEKMDYYDRIGYGSGPLQNTDEQVEYLLKALEIAKRSNSFVKMSHLYSTLAYLYLKKGDYKRSLQYNLEAKEICLEIDNRFELGMIFKNLGDLYLTTEQYEESIDSYLKSLKYKDEFTTTQTLVDFANIIFPIASLALLYIKSGNLKEAENYLFQSYKLLSKYHFGKDIQYLLTF